MSEEPFTWHRKRKNSDDDIFRIDRRAGSDVRIRRSDRRIKVYMTDCTDNNIDWIFRRNIHGLAKVKRVIAIFKSIEEELERNINKDKT